MNYEAVLFRTLQRPGQEDLILKCLKKGAGHNPAPGQRPYAMLCREEYLPLLHEFQVPILGSYTEAPFRYWERVLSLPWASGHYYSLRRAAFFSYLGEDIPPGRDRPFLPELLRLVAQWKQQLRQVATDSLQEDQIVTSELQLV